MDGKTIKMLFVAVITLLALRQTSCNGVRYDPLSRDKTNPSICAEQASVAEQELCFARNGVVRAMEVCKEQFKKERWNCPETSFIPLLEAAATTQEGAYIKALTSAMIAYEISRACFDGYLLGECDCSFHLYSFASHNTHYTVCESKLAISLKISQKFMDGDSSRLMEPWKVVQQRYKARYLPSRIFRTHNNRAGRKIFTQLTVVRTKCQGMSGGCEVKAVFREAPKLSVLSKRLLQQYRQAKKVSSFTALLLPNRSVPMNEIVYIHDPPNFCKRRPFYGYPGVVGRRCNPPIPGHTPDPDLPACSDVCCGPGFRRKQIKAAKKVRTCHMRPHTLCCVRDCMVEETTGYISVYECR